MLNGGISARGLEVVFESSEDGRLAVEGGEREPVLEAMVGGRESGVLVSEAAVEWSSVVEESWRFAEREVRKAGLDERRISRLLRDVIE